MLAEVQEGVTAGGGTLVGSDAQHVQQAERGNRPLRGVGLRFIVAPIAFRALQGEQLLHQGLLGDGRLGFLHFGVTGGPVKNIHQRPIADRWIFRIEQPGKRIAVQMLMPVLHCKPLTRRRRKNRRLLVIRQHFKCLLCCLDSLRTSLFHKPLKTFWRIRSIEKILRHLTPSIRLDRIVVASSMRYNAANQADFDILFTGVETDNPIQE
jgi:hypothetical protein